MMAQMVSCEELVREIVSSAVEGDEEARYLICSPAFLVMMRKSDMNISPEMYGSTNEIYHQLVASVCYTHGIGACRNASIAGGHIMAAIKIDPNNVVALIMMGLWCQYFADVAGAKRYFDKALAINSCPLARYYKVLLMMHRRAGGYTDALETLMDLHRLERPNRYDTSELCFVFVQLLRVADIITSRYFNVCPSHTIRGALTYILNNCDFGYSGYERHVPPKIENYLDFHKK